MPVVKFSLDSDSIQQAIDDLKKYKKKLEKAAKEMAKQLSELGFDVAFSIMDGHIFTGDTINSLDVKQTGNNTFVLVANSKAILFFEFGAGVKYGKGHPLAGEFGYGPGTYPGKGHWDDPNGWYYPTDDPRLIVKTTEDGKTYGHSYGNKPHMPFYNASKTMRENILKIAREVLK